MATLPVEKMRELERRFAEIEARMAEGPAADVYVKLASQYSELQPVVTKIRASETAEKELAELEGHRRSHFVGSTASGDDARTGDLRFQRLDAAQKVADLDLAPHHHEDKSERGVDDLKPDARGEEERHRDDAPAGKDIRPSREKAPPRLPQSR